MPTEEKYDPNSMIAVEKYDPHTMVPAAAPKEGTVLATNPDKSIMAVPGSIADTLSWTGINNPNTQGGRGVWRHIADEANQATNKGFGGLIARTLMGNSNYANMPELATATGQIDNLYNHLNSVDPSWRDDDGKVQGFLKAAAGMLGSSLGAVNPLYAVGGVAGGAKGLLPRIAQAGRSAGKVGGASALGDVIIQGLNRTQGVDEGKPLDWGQALAAGLGGALFGGGTDALGQLWSHFKSRGFNAAETPDPLLNTGDRAVPAAETRNAMTPEEFAAYDNVVRNGTDDEVRAFRDQMEQKGFVIPKEQIEDFLTKRAQPNTAVPHAEAKAPENVASPSDEIVVSAGPRMHPRGELTVEQFPRQDEFGNTFNDIRIRDPKTGKETHFGEHYDNGEIILRDSKTTKPIKMTPEDYDAIRALYEPPKPIGTPEEAPATGPAPDELAVGPKEEPFDPEAMVAAGEAPDNVIPFRQEAAAPGEHFTNQNEPKFVTGANDNPMGSMSAEEPRAPVDNWTDRTGTPANDNGAGGDTPPPPPPGDGTPPPPGGGEPPVNIENVLNKLRSGMKTWRRMTREQKELYRKQRGERLADSQRIAEDTGGREGFYQRLSALRGEMKKLQFQPQEDVFTPQEMDALFEHITKSDKLSPWEQFSAGRGLDKIMKGEMPQAGELAKLAKVLDPETISGLLKNRTLWQKVLAGAEQVVGLPKSFKSSMDLSAPFNQGVFLAGKKEWNQAFLPMIRDFADGKYHEQSMLRIQRDPEYDLSQKAGLALADEHSPDLGQHEDAFRARWAEKVPVVGTGIHMSERAYNGFLNRVRFDTFKMMLNKARDLGFDEKLNPEGAKAIAHYVNVVTGRGSLGSFEAAAQTLSTVLFSPRLLSARIESITNPMLYVNLPKGARMEAMKDWIRFGSMITAATSLASFALGAKVDTNPTSSDFMKIRIGNTRHDLFGGWQQLAVLAARLATNSRTSSHGKTTELGSSPTTPDFVGTIANFIRGKLSPAAGYVVDWREGKDITGQPFQVGKNTMDLFIPMFIDDLAKNIGMYGPAGGAAQSADAVFGVRQQTYDENRSYTQSRFPNATVKDPLVDEIARLSAVNKGSITPGVEKTIRWSEEGERRSYTLTDDEYQQYKDLTEKYTKEDLSQLVKTPEWKTADDKTKIGWVREAAREQKNRAMDELFFNDHESAPPMSYEDYVNAQQ